MKSKYYLALIISFICLTGYAQNKHTISGYIKDVETGETLIGASVIVDSLNIGTITNVYGFYSLTLPVGIYKVGYSYVGFETQYSNVNLDNNITIDIEMVPSVTSLKTVVVTAEDDQRNVTSTEMSVNKLSAKEISHIPVVFGEKDIIKTLQLLPGIASAGEGSGGFYVRGGSADQNLILLDEAPVYNASHLLGFFSVFNTDAIKDMTIYKGGIPAEFGGRISSVLDIQMKEGNAKKLSGTGGLGLISSRLLLEGPIVKDKGSFMVSGRRTYADMFLKLSNDKSLNSSRLYFYDFNMKTNYKIGEKDRVFLSGYFGRDNFEISDQLGFDWGNKTATLRWNHLFNDRLFLNSTVIYSDYNYNIKVYGEDEEDEVNITSAIRDWNLKEDFEYYLNTDNTIKFGLEAIYHTFQPGKVSAGANRGVNNQKLDQKYAVEATVYASNESRLNSRVLLSYGLRFSTFSQFGPGTVVIYDSDGAPISSKEYERGDIIETYAGLEPRLAGTFLLNPTTSLKASYARTRQYLHLLSDSEGDSPTDVWLPSSANIKPQIADQIAVGYFRNFKENKYEGSVEVYYKNMQNQVDYKTGADLVFNSDVEAELLFGKGWSYGVELYMKKKVGRFNGWLSYTWSKTERKFDGIDNGEVFNATQDRTHDFSAVGIYQLNDKWSFSTAWVYNTGRAVTFPVGKYRIEGEMVSLYDKRNSYRMPDYHRLDISATYARNKGKRFSSSWNFSLYNVYGRKNAYSIMFRESSEDPSRSEAVKLSLYSIIPSITYNFKF